MIPAGVFLYTFLKKIQHWAKKINALASGNVGDEKNLHPGSRKKFFY